MRRTALGSCLLAAITASASAQTVVLGATKDNTLFESPTGTLSAGASQNLYVGRTSQFQDSRRRGLLAFDVAGSVPAGAHIDSATLTLHCNRTQADEEPVWLHRALANWGESGSNGSRGNGGGGTGAPAQSGDATWLHTFYSSQFWTNAGGDFVATASALRLVDGANVDYQWSGPGLAADVQLWLDEPAQNFGWVIVGNEQSALTTKRFSSRTHFTTGERPDLRISYSFPAPCPGDTNDDGVVDVNDLNNVILDWGTSGSVNGGDITGATPGSPPDGVVNVNDLNAIVVAWGDCP